MNYFKKRQWKKNIQDVLRQARHAMNMREDVAPAADVAAVRDAAAALRSAWTAREEEPALEAAASAVLAASARLLPPRTGAKWRENIEVLVVAISLAMACKCFFLQPFKIPTGSMQPTLNGIIARPAEKNWTDTIPIKYLKIAIFGSYYVEVRAKASGILSDLRRSGDQMAYFVGGFAHPVHLTIHNDTRQIVPSQSMTLHAQPGDHIEKGQLIASGLVTRGDQVFVNKVLYHFSPPRRGQIIVFDTDHIPDKEHFDIAAGTFYIKRLVGLPGESVSIRDRHLVIDGTPVEEPPVFARQANDPTYDGYVTRYASRLPSARSSIAVGPCQFLPFGDNTHSSLDGRYFGPVSEKALVGPAFFVYWPFGPHWGFAR